MAANLTADLIHRYIYREDVEIKEVNCPGLDKTYIADEGSRKHVFAYLDNQVIHITYYGKEKVEDFIPLLPQRLRFQKQEVKEG